MRMAGVNVGKVKSKELDAGGARTIVEVQLDEPYAPIPKDTPRDPPRRRRCSARPTWSSRPATGAAGMLDDGGRLANAQVEDTVELDEIFTAFDPDTRQAFQRLGQGARRARSRTAAAQDLSDAFGNFEGFAVDGAKLMQVLDEQNVAVHRLVKQHRRGVRGDQRAPRRAARADRELEADLRGHRVARRGAGRDVRDLPDLPRREQGDDGAARGLLALRRTRS